VSEPAFSAPAAKVYNPKAMVIGRQLRENEDIDEVVARVAKAEGYNVLGFRLRETPWAHGTKVIREAIMTVEPAYSARTGVPGCCEPGAMPDHYPSSYCGSSKRPHCTCDRCF